MTDNEKIYVTKTFMPPMEEYMEEIRDLWDSAWITNMGEKHRELEEKLRCSLGVDALSLMSNGHMALEMCLAAMHLVGEVITTPFTFASTTHAIARNHLTPVFCDIRPDDYTIDASKIEDLITEHTCAILPVHVYGNVCDVDAIADIADRHGLKVVYDAAHAFGVERDGRGIGTYGDASVFSFHATKVFHTVEGGAVSYSDPAFGQRLYELKNFGILDETTVAGIGANAKMSEFHAAMGIVNLRYHEANVRRREAIWKIYCRELSGIDGLQIPEDARDKAAQGTASRCRQSRNYSYFPVVIDPEAFGADRDQVAERLALQNVFVRKYFYPLSSDYDCYKGILAHGETPVADRVSASVITLPLFPSMRKEDAYRICDMIRNCRL